MDKGVQRREFIKARIEAIRHELDELLLELGAGETGLDEAEQRRRKFTIIKGGLLLLLLLLSLGYLVARFRRPLLAASAAAAASVVAVAVLGHGAPRGTAPPLGLGSQSAMTSMSASGAPVHSRYPTSVPRPRRTPLVPVVPPTRLRRPSSSPVVSRSSAGAGPSPLPSPSAAPSRVPSLRPSGSPAMTPAPSPSRCAVAVRLDVLRLALKLCV